MFATLRRLLSVSALANQPGAPPVDELTEMAREGALTRREYLKSTGAALSGVIPSQVKVRKRRKGAGKGRGKGAAPGAAEPPRRGNGSAPVAGPGQGKPTQAPSRSTGNVHAPNIVVVGAGIAGLNAMFRLRGAGLSATLYSADARIGGRIASQTNLLAPGVTTELGAEFIDSSHGDILNIVKLLGLPLRDYHKDPLLDEAYFFNGAYSSSAQIIEAYRPLARQIAHHASLLPDDLSYLNRTPFSVWLDRMSIAEYLDWLGVTGVLKQLLGIAYLSEDGMEIEQQSSLNLVWTIGTSLRAGFLPFGESDERFTVVGGNVRMIEGLLGFVADRVRPGHQLVAIRNRGQGFVLTFLTASGPTVEVPAEIVILAMPFSILRQIDMRIPMPIVKQQAITQLGYGSNTKIQFGVRNRPWRAMGLSGDVITDQPLQNAWDSSRLQPGPGGALSLFIGGEAARTTGSGTADDQVRRFLPGAELLFPGIGGQLNGQTVRSYWPGDPFVQASYSNYATGQYTSIGGAQASPVGNLFFAGEHCNHPDLGEMNSGARTGRLAAEAVIARVREG